MNGFYQMAFWILVFVVAWLVFAAINALKTFDAIIHAMDSLKRMTCDLSNEMFAMQGKPTIDYEKLTKQEDTADEG